MSQNYGAVPPSTTTTGTETTTGKTDTAKQEASEVAGTAKAEAGHVLGTAKQEAGTVAREAKYQAKQVLSQSKQKLNDQASTQKQRAADGLRSISDELQSLASKSDSSGFATDLVSQASTKLNDISSWLSNREPGDLLEEVKTFARRKPGLFIGGALVAGVLAGRLTRALTESAKEEHDVNRVPVTGTGVGASSGYGVGGYETGTTVPTGTGVTSGTGYGTSGTGYGATGTTGTGYTETTGTGYTTGTAGSGTVEPGFGSGVSGITPTPQGGQPATTTGAAGESTPLYDDERAANPAAELGFDDDDYRETR